MAKHTDDRIRGSVAGAFGTRNATNPGIAKIEIERARNAYSSILNMKYTVSPGDKFSSARKEVFQNAAAAFDLMLIPQLTQKSNSGQNLMFTALEWNEKNIAAIGGRHLGDIDEQIKVLGDALNTGKFISMDLETLGGANAAGFDTLGTVTEYSFAAHSPEGINDYRNVLGLKQSEYESIKGIIEGTKDKGMTQREQVLMSRMSLYDMAKFSTGADGRTLMEFTGDVGSRDVYSRAAALRGAENLFKLGQQQGVESVDSLTNQIYKRDMDTIGQMLRSQEYSLVSQNAMAFDIHQMKGMLGDLSGIKHADMLQLNRALGTLSNDPLGMYRGKYASEISNQPFSLDAIKGAFYKGSQYGVAHTASADALFTGALINSNMPGENESYGSRLLNKLTEARSSKHAATMSLVPNEFLFRAKESISSYTGGISPLSYSYDSKAGSILSLNNILIQGGQAKSTGMNKALIAKDTLFRVKGIYNINKGLDNSLTAIDPKISKGGYAVHVAHMFDSGTLSESLEQEKMLVFRTVDEVKGFFGSYADPVAQWNGKKPPTDGRVNINNIKNWKAIEESIMQHDLPRVSGAEMGEINIKNIADPVGFRMQAQRAKILESAKRSFEGNPLRQLHKALRVESEIGTKFNAGAILQGGNIINKIMISGAAKSGELLEAYHAIVNADLASFKNFQGEKRSIEEFRNIVAISEYAREMSGPINAILEAVGLGDMNALAGLESVSDQKAYEFAEAMSEYSNQLTMHTEGLAGSELAFNRLRDPERLANTFQYDIASAFGRGKKYVSMGNKFVEKSGLATLDLSSPQSIVSGVLSGYRSHSGRSKLSEAKEINVLRNFGKKVANLNEDILSQYGGSTHSIAFQIRDALMQNPNKSYTGVMGERSFADTGLEKRIWNKHGAGIMKNVSAAASQASKVSIIGAQNASSSEITSFVNELMNKNIYTGAGIDAFKNKLSGVERDAIDIALGNAQKEARAYATSMITGALSFKDASIALSHSGDLFAIQGSNRIIPIQLPRIKADAHGIYIEKGGLKTALHSRIAVDAKAETIKLGSTYGHVTNIVKDPAKYLKNRASRGYTLDEAISQVGKATSDEIMERAGVLRRDTAAGMTATRFDISELPKAFTFLKQAGMLGSLNAGYWKNFSETFDDYSSMGTTRQQDFLINFKSILNELSGSSYATKGSDFDRLLRNATGFTKDTSFAKGIVSIGTPTTSTPGSMFYNDSRPLVYQNMQEYRYDIEEASRIAKDIGAEDLYDRAANGENAITSEGYKNFRDAKTRLSGRTLRSTIAEDVVNISQDKIAQVFGDESRIDAVAGRFGANKDIAKREIQATIDRLSVYESEAILDPKIAEMFFGQQYTQTKTIMDPFAIMQHGASVNQQLEEYKLLGPKVSISNGQISFRYLRGKDIVPGQATIHEFGEYSTSSNAAKYKGTLKVGVFEDGRLLRDTQVQQILDNGRITSEEGAYKHLEEIGLKVKTYIQRDGLDYNKIFIQGGEKTMAYSPFMALGQIDKGLADMFSKNTRGLGPDLVGQIAGIDELKAATGQISKATGESFDNIWSRVVQERYAMSDIIRGSLGGAGMATHMGLAGHGNQFMELAGYANRIINERPEKLGEIRNAFLNAGVDLSDDVSSISITGLNKGTSSVDANSIMKALDSAGGDLLKFGNIGTVGRFSLLAGENESGGGFSRLAALKGTGPAGLSQIEKGMPISDSTLSALRSNRYTDSARGVLFAGADAEHTQYLNRLFEGKLTEGGLLKTEYQGKAVAQPIIRNILNAHLNDPETIKKIRGLGNAMSAIKYNENGLSSREVKSIGWDVIKRSDLKSVVDREKMGLRGADQEFFGKNMIIDMGEAGEEVTGRRYIAVPSMPNKLMSVGEDKRLVTNPAVEAVGILANRIQDWEGANRGESTDPDAVLKENARLKSATNRLVSGIATSTSKSGIASEVMKHRMTGSFRGISKGIAAGIDANGRLIGTPGVLEKATINGKSLLEHMQAGRFYSAAFIGESAFEKMGFFEDSFMQNTLGANATKSAMLNMLETQGVGALVQRHPEIKSTSTMISRLFLDRRATGNMFELTLGLQGALNADYDSDKIILGIIQDEHARTTLSSQFNDQTRNAIATSMEYGALDGRYYQDSMLNKMIDYKNDTSYAESIKRFEANPLINRSTGTDAGALASKANKAAVGGINTALSKVDRLSDILTMRTFGGDVPGRSAEDAALRLRIQQEVRDVFEQNIISSMKHDQAGAPEEAARRVKRGEEIKSAYQTMMWQNYESGDNAVKRKNAMSTLSGYLRSAEDFQSKSVEKFDYLMSTVHGAHMTQDFEGRYSGVSVASSTAEQKAEYIATMHEETLVAISQDEQKVRSMNNYLKVGSSYAPGTSKLVDSYIMQNMGYADSFAGNVSNQLSLVGRNMEDMEHLSALENGAIDWGYGGERGSASSEIRGMMSGAERVFSGAGDALGKVSGKGLAIGALGIAASFMVAGFVGGNPATPTYTDEIDKAAIRENRGDYRDFVEGPNLVDPGIAKQQQTGYTISVRGNSQKSKQDNAAIIQNAVNSNYGTSNITLNINNRGSNINNRDMEQMLASIL